MKIIGSLESANTLVRSGEGRGRIRVKSTMDRTVREHITLLEQRLEELTSQLMNSDLSLMKRNEVDADIRAATLALSYYRQALELEKRIR